MTGLILAGTYEARMLCAACLDDNIPAIASLAGETRNPTDLGIETRIGGFGGAAGFETFLKQSGITWLIDATHPFATKMTARAAVVCASLNIPCIALQRPAWQPAVGDDWHMIDAISELQDIIPIGKTVFLGTGRKTLMEYGCLDGRRLLCRVIDQPVSDFPLENGAYLVDRPPFSIEQEVATFQEHNVDWLVVKNAGGSGGYSKLAAARQMGLPVAVLKRQTPANIPVVTDVPAALEWLKKIIQ